MTYTEALERYLAAYLEKQRLESKLIDSDTINTEYASGQTGNVELSIVSGWENNVNSVENYNDAIIPALDNIMLQTEPLITDLLENHFDNSDGITVNGYIISINEGGDIVIEQDTTTT